MPTSERPKPEDVARELLAIPIAGWTVPGLAAIIRRALRQERNATRRDCQRAIRESAGNAWPLQEWLDAANFIERLIEPEPNAAALDAARQERDREWQRRGHADDKCFYRAGPVSSIAAIEHNSRAEVFEQAAGIAENWPGMNQDADLRWAADGIAAAIRARAKEGRRA